MGIEIEDGIPVPPAAGRASKYPWDVVSVGQSFFIPGRQKKLLVPKRLKPRKFTQRIDETGLRVWRTA